MSDLILVDPQNRPLGTMEKLEVHQKGLLHRAFSIIITNQKGEWLLQRRALEKYHCGGLWANATCSHPNEGEETIDAAHRRLQEEMGFDTELEEQYSFVYRAEFPNGLIEHEHDTVFLGQYDGLIDPNPEEVMETKWMTLEEIEADIERNPEKYAAWFTLLVKQNEKLKMKN